MTRKRLKHLSLLYPLPLLVLLALMPEACARGVGEGLGLCAQLLIPTIFPMLFGTILLVECGTAQALGRMLAKPAEVIFRLPGSSASALLLALIGGYPAGAKAVAELYERGAASKKQAERMLLFCFSAGPAFLLGAVGAMAKSTAAGAILLLANSMSVVLLGFLCGLLFERDERGELETALKNSEDVKKAPFSEALTVSAQKAASAMLSICIFVVVFSILASLLCHCHIDTALSALLQRIGVGKAAADALLPIILEVSAGSKEAIKAGLPLAGFCVGFGGLAVHAQVWSLAGRLELNKPLFLLMRLLQGLLTAGFTRLFLLFAPETTASIAIPARAMPTAAGSALLMLLCVFCAAGSRSKNEGFFGAERPSAYLPKF